ncbi:MAG: hypothetical protein QM770_01275 [Tepidisphaeraceae bacterium]
MLVRRFVDAVDEAKATIVRSPKIGKRMRGLRARDRTGLFEPAAKHAADFLEVRPQQ